MRLRHRVPDPRLVQFDGEQPLVLLSAGVGEGPTAHVREPDAPNPTARLVVQQQLIDLGLVQ